MKFSRVSVCTLLAGLVFVAAGCATFSSSPGIVRVGYTEEEPDAAQEGVMWQPVPVHSFVPGTAGGSCREIEKANAMDKKVRDTAQVRFLWSSDALYVGIVMADGDLVDESVADSGKLPAASDCVVLFLKHSGCRDYWEFCGNVRGRHSTCHYLSRGLLGLPGNNGYNAFMAVSAIADGTINRSFDVDRGWKILFKIPKKELVRHGAPWKAGEAWRFLLVRHNYSRYLPSREVTVFPRFTAQNLHSYEEWGTLVLVKPEGK